MPETLRIGIICQQQALAGCYLDWLKANPAQFEFVEPFVSLNPTVDSVGRLEKMMESILGQRKINREYRVVNFENENILSALPEVDLYVNFSSAKPPEALLPKSKYGVLQFDFLRDNFSSAVAAIAESNPTIKTVFLHFQKDGIEYAIYECIFRTINHSFKKHVDFINEQCLYLLPILIAKIAKGISLPKIKHIEPAQVHFGYSSFNFKFTILMNRVKHLFNTLFTAYKWNIGVIEKPLHELLETTGTKPEIQWMKEENGLNFNADPFAIEKNNELIIYYEHFDSKAKIGSIKKSAYQNKKFSLSLSILKDTVHLSYPYTFEHDQKYYALAESSQKNNLSLYSINDSGNFIDPVIILNNVDAVDSSIIQWNNRWWLFCTQKNHKLADLALSVYYADNLNGSWTAHALNPVKCDVTSSRPGGKMFVKNEKLYRPVQDSSTTYGGSLKLLEVTTLTEFSFSEREEIKIAPAQLQSKYNKGLHTLSSTANYTVLDAKRKVFTLTKLIAYLTGN